MNKGLFIVRSMSKDGNTIHPAKFLTYSKSEALVEYARIATAKTLVAIIWENDIVIKRSDEEIK
jgi:hypothetical protein